MFAITISESGGQPSKFEFHKLAITVGRMKGNDIVLPKGNVSKKHATISLRDSAFFIQDHNSTNGTYINGAQVPRGAELAITEVDKIYIGDFIIQVEAIAQASQQPPSSGHTFGGEAGGRAGFETLFDPGSDGHDPLRSTMAAMDHPGFGPQATIPPEQQGGAIAPPPPQDFNAQPTNGFGQPPANQFGGQPQPPANQFGGPPQPPANQFGGPPQPPANQFGGQPANQFGQPPANQFGGQPQQPANSQFGGPPQPPANQFGGQPQADPFGGQPANNQFGGQPQADPFGGQPASNQFGDGATYSHDDATPNPSAAASFATDSSNGSGAIAPPPPQEYDYAEPIGAASSSPSVVPEADVAASVPSNPQQSIAPPPPQEYDYAEPVQSTPPTPPTTPAEPAAHAIAPPPPEHHAGAAAVAPAETGAPAAHEAVILQQPPSVESRFDAALYEAQVAVANALFEANDPAAMPRQYPAGEEDRDFWRQQIDAALDAVDPQDINQDLLADLLLGECVGLGPLERYLDEIETRDIYVNRHDQILIRQGGALVVAPYVYSHPEFLHLTAERLLGEGAQDLGADEVRFGDGTRVHVVLPPLAVDGPLITVRKPPTEQPQLVELLERGVISPAAADFLMHAIDAGRSVAIVGPTSSGKTTMLAALANLIPDGIRIISVEDRSQLVLPQRSAVRLEANPSAGFDKRFLLASAATMHPQRILLDECRGPEAYDWVTSVASGTEGSMITLHGTHAADGLGRLESLCLMGSPSLSPRGLREQIARAVHLVVVVNLYGDSQFRVQQIAEVQGVDLDTFRTNDIFAMRADGLRVALQPTGYIPTFYEDLRQSGVDVDFDIFRE